jgi:PTH1 family peptidyl-tRNA hydrolase
MAALIAGLGNPGSQYAQTRHNIGFWFVDALARRLGVSFSSQRRSAAELAQADCQGERLWLLKPQSFMNRSGGPVVETLRYYKVPAERLLVVYDDLDLPPGRIRVREKGGHGGHNGMRDIIRQLGHQDFPRLRLGIGHPGHASAVSGYVLSRPPAADQVLMEQAVERALDALPEWLAGNWQQLQSNLHTDSA